jgi:hypothetical protein
MRFCVYDDARVGLLRGDTVVDVIDLVGADGARPPTFLLRAIAQVDGLRSRLEETLRTRPGVPVAPDRLRARVVFPSKVRMDVERIGRLSERVALRSA